MSRPEGGHLLDVNVLVALTWPDHVHHEAAQRWFARLDGSPWATTPATESGFVCVSLHPSVTQRAVSWSGALDMLVTIRMHGLTSDFGDQQEVLVDVEHREADKLGGDGH